MKNTMNKDLTLEQLTMVNGGVIGEVVHDSWSLYKLGLIDEEISGYDAIFHWETSSAKVDAAWAKIGITCVSHPASDNEYYYQGRSITQDEAVKIAQNLMIKGPRIG